jgi:TolB-like protein
LGSPLQSLRLARFGGFFLDLRAAELHKGTERIRLQDKPFQMLRLLLEYSGEVVTQEELRKTLWPGGTVVEFDYGIATALKKLRQALGDDADHPRYVETLARRGYRWIAGVEWVESGEKPQISQGADETIDSIAVLPFANLGDPEQDYFCEGLAEEILNALTRVPGLRVTARTSSFSFRGKEQDIRQIGRALNVRSILEGSVRHSDNRIRITVQLIHAGTGYHLWSESYDRELRDVFDVQDEIATAITAALQGRLSVAFPSPRSYTPGLSAYEAYLKARYHWGKITPKGLAHSKEYYEQAIALDPGFALAHVGLADYYLLLANAAGKMPAHEAMPLVRAHAKRALALDPSLPEAHAMLGIVAGLYDHDWKESEQLFQVAMTGDAVSPLNDFWYGYFYLAVMGRFNEKTEWALQADPLNLVFRISWGSRLAAAGRLEDASTEYRRVLELDENSFAACMLLAQTYALGEMYALALPLAEKAHLLAPWHTGVIGTLAAVLRRTGNQSRAEHLLEPLRNSPETYGAPRGLVAFHLACKEVDQAADWAEKCVEQRDPVLPTLLPFFRSSSRWPMLAKIMNLPE